MDNRVSYNNLFELLAEKGMTKSELATEVGLSSATLAKLAKGQVISMNKLIDICQYLNCSFDDVVSSLLSWLDSLDIKRDFSSLHHPDDE